MATLNTFYIVHSYTYNNDKEKGMYYCISMAAGAKRTGQNATLYLHSLCGLMLKLVVHKVTINLLKPTGHVMHQQFNIQQLHALPTLYLCVLYLSENKQRLVPLTA